MFRYRFFGDTIVSAEEFPELQPGADGIGAAWHCGPGRPLRRATWNAVRDWRDPDGGVWLRLSTAGTSYQLEFSVGVTFAIDGQEILWAAEDALPRETIRHLLLDQVLPLAMSTKGAMVVHSSGIAVDAGAVLFVGESGIGKSTLAAWCATGGDGFLADDCVRIDEHGEGWTARGSYPGARVWPDTAARCGIRLSEGSAVAHYTSKLRVPVGTWLSEAVKLRRIYLVCESNGDEPRLREPMSSAIIDLTRYVFRLDVADRGRLAEDFARAFRLIDGGYVRYLDVPGSLSCLDRVRDLIRLDLGLIDAGLQASCA